MYNKKIIVLTTGIKFQWKCLICQIFINLSTNVYYVQLVSWFFRQSYYLVAFFIRINFFTKNKPARWGVVTFEQHPARTCEGCFKYREKLLREVRSSWCMGYSNITRLRWDSLWASVLGHSREQVRQLRKERNRENKRETNERDKRDSHVV